MSDTRTEKAKRSCFLPRTRCTENERLALEAKAQAAGLSLSEYQRRALLNSGVNVRHRSVDVQASQQLSGIGRNLNQLVKAVHIHGEYDRQQLHALLSALEPLILGLMDGS